jgi:hypothetical protein
MGSKNLDGTLVKKAHSKQKWTEKDIDELIKCQHENTGPSYFLNHFFHIQHPTQGKLQYQAYEYQTHLLNSYHEHRFSINMLGRQMGKALSLETPILTPNEFVILKDLKVGDVIYGRDGKPTNITFITETMENRPCYEIIFMHGEKIIADAEHLWNIVLPKTKEEITVNTLELLSYFNKFKNTSQSLHIKASNCIDFEYKEVPIDPYYLGLWLGDGGTKDLRITCTMEDYIEYSRIFTNKGLEISQFKLDKRSDKTGTFYIKGGTKKFKELGVWGNKHIPDLYIFNSKEIRLELLKGLMDSDGTCEKTGVSRFYQSNEKFIDKVRILLSTLGIKSTKGEIPTTHKTAYTLCFAEKKLEIFNLSRKLERQRNLLDHPKNKRVYIKEISLINSVPVRCLQVDNHDHMFLCGETLIPTHNTTTAVGYLLWYAMFVPNSTILIAAHKYTGAQEIMQRIRYAYELCPDHIRCGATSYNKQSLEFDNGSRIIAQTTTETTGRGMSVSLLYCDEFAYVAPTMATEFWTSISPTLATGGKAIITSTPNSDEDQFAQIWNEACKRFDEYGNETALGRNGFYSYKAVWSEHPDRGEEWAITERARVGEERFRREHECEFLVFDETLINSISLSNLEGSDPITKMGQARWYKKINPHSTYIFSLDPSLGTGGDYAAIEVLELPSMEQVAEWHHNQTPIQIQVRILRDMIKYVDDECIKGGASSSIYYSVENNTVGESALMAITEIGEDTFPGLFLSEPIKKGHLRRFRKGFNTTHASKISACSKLKQLIESKQIKIYSKTLISELKTFVATGITFKAKVGQHDDLVSSLLLAIRMILILQEWDPTVYEKMRDQTGLEDYDLPMPIFINTY